MEKFSSLRVFFVVPLNLILYKKSLCLGYSKKQPVFFLLETKKQRYSWGLKIQIITELKWSQGYRNTKGHFEDAQKFLPAKWI